MSARASVLASPESYRRALGELVALDTVSPMSEESLAAAGEVLGKYGCERIESELFGLGDPAAAVWMYAHVDTKPPAPEGEWRTPPFTLTAIQGKLYGLGVSDSKFQLLNALALADVRSHFVLVDTSEEHSGSGAASSLIRSRHPETLVVCDGVRSDHDVNLGMCGQVDGVISLRTGAGRLHPARGGGDVSTMLRGLLEQLCSDRMRMTMTGIEAPRAERSLSLQEVDVRFDMRYTRDQAHDVQEFLAQWPCHVRQWLPPVVGTQDTELPNLSCGGPASFSSRLCVDGPLGVRQVVVVPGAQADNYNHQPNEHIHLAQIDRNLSQLRCVLAELCRGSE